MPLGRTVVAGLVLAVVATLAVTFGDALGLDLETAALVGAACGGVLGLVSDRGPWARLGGFMLGLIVAWAGYGLRAAVLPDTSGGRAIATFLVLALCVALSAATLARLPLWSFLVGVAAMAGAYETTFMISPPDFVKQSTTAATTVLVMAALGFASTVIFSLLHGDEEADASAPTLGGRRDGGDSSNVRLDDLMTTKDGN
jgi:hypothetical protein